MPTINVQGTSIHYQDSGRGTDTVVFAHGLLMSSAMFKSQIDVLEKHYRCVALDFRGQGNSEVTATGYDVDTLTEDVVELIRKLDLAPCHFAGLSMGGFVGLRIGIRYPELLKSLILINTSAGPEPRENLPKYTILNFIARWFGLKLVISRIMPIMFGPNFLTDPDRKQVRDHWKKIIEGNDRMGITRAVKGVIHRAGVVDQLGQISAPTLIITGEADGATVPAKSEQMKSLIPNARMVSISRSGHSSTIEEPQAVTAAIGEFLGRISQEV